MTLFKKTYRAESARLQEWDYASAGWYFVTICTRDQRCFFGTVVDAEMHLSATGRVAQQYWVEVPDHFRRARLDEFVIMPNHVHGIVILEGNIPTVEPRDLVALPAGNRFGPLQRGSLSALVNSYKSAVTRWCRKHGHPGFAWQARFYDHIIRDDESLAKIREYIVGNPVKWEADKYYTRDR